MDKTLRLEKEPLFDYLSGRSFSNGMEGNGNLQQNRPIKRAKNQPMDFTVLPDFPLNQRNSLGNWFVSLKLYSYHAAAQYVCSIPYGRTTDRSNYRLVLKEGRGTCSTKHALLTELAQEHGQSIDLLLGIYEMDEQNTPGVGATLRKYGLALIPEAHCYLAYRGTRIDFTRPGTITEPAGSFLTEERIEPHQIGEYKVKKHRKSVCEWAEAQGLDFEYVWRAREECIAALANSH